MFLRGFIVDLRLQRSRFKLVIPNKSLSERGDKPIMALGLRIPTPLVYVSQLSLLFATRNFVKQLSTKITDSDYGPRSYQSTFSWPLLLFAIRYSVDKYCRQGTKQLGCDVEPPTLTLDSMRGQITIHGHNHGAGYPCRFFQSRDHRQNTMGPNCCPESRALKISANRRCVRIFILQPGNTSCGKYCIT